MSDTTLAGGNLLRNCVLFGRMLHALGVDVTPSQMVDLIESLRYIDIMRREDFKDAARAILVSRQEHLVVFELAFGLFWQARAQGELLSWDMSQFQRRRQEVKPALLVLESRRRWRI